MKKKLFIVIIICLCIAAVLCVSGYFLIKSRSFQLFGKIVNRVDTDKSVVALTLDDGPTDKTPEILGILGELDIKCTFFLTGSQMEENMEYTRSIAAAGHQIGNHSYSHQRMVLKSYGFMENEIDSTSELIKKSGYAGEIVFRPPGCKKLMLLPLALQERQMTTVTWDVEPDSYPDVASDSEKIAQYVIEHARKGSVILLHVMYDKGEESLKAIPAIVEGLRSKGFEFVTVNELLAQSNG